MVQNPPCWRASYALGHFKTKKMQIYLDEVALLWMSQWTACSPAWRILYHVTVSCKGPIGRALHRYRRGHGFESRSSLIFFQAFVSQLHITAMIIHLFFLKSVMFYILRGRLELVTIGVIGKML